MNTNFNDVISKVLIDEDSIQKKIKQISTNINQFYEDEPQDVLLVGILRGSIMFMSDLAKYLKIDCKLDFMDVSSYGDSTESSGNVKIVKDLDTDVKDLNVLIIEDIIDSGNTLYFLVDTLKQRGAKSIKIVTLLDKPERREKDVQPDWTGFKIPDEFVVGYGLDYAQHYRNLPYIGVLKREVYEK